MKPILLKLFLFASFSIIILIPQTSKAYSILTHEAIIDASWEKSLKPLLKDKFPKATDAELKLAHSYAYGGTLMTDIGYSPFGSVYFTNLIHYVRSGDFVENLLGEAKNINEYAYALGALCHYMADRYGHSIGTNLVVPKTYPKIGKKFGPSVTYEEDNASHSRVEIAFDVLQLARGNYATQAYHDLVGFNVSVPVLERAFLKTYGQDIHLIFGNIDRSINNFRWAVNTLMPTVTRAAWLLKKDEIKQMNPSITARQFHYKMKRKQYFQEFGRDRDKPKFGARVLAFVITILPKVGALKTFRFKQIGTEGEKQFIKSFDAVMNHYSDALTQLNTGKLNLPDVDFDTGNLTTIGEYKLTDKSYNELLDNLDDSKFNYLTGPLKQHIISFYAKADTVALAKEDGSEWKKTSIALQHLKGAPLVPVDSLKLYVSKEK